MRLYEFDSARKDGDGSPQEGFTAKVWLENETFFTVFFDYNIIDDVWKAKNYQGPNEYLPAVTSYSWPGGPLIPDEVKRSFERHWVKFPPMPPIDRID
jgi:hypothetical protein